MTQTNIKLSDNLEFMKSIEDNSIDLIYCDILYATGRKFNDYQDLKPIKSVVYDHYVSRVTEMYRILKTTGSIYLQMDTNVNHWLRCILDDILGYENFRNEIVWKRSDGMNQKYKYFPKTKDHILYYTKSKDYTFNVLTVASNESTNQRYDKIDSEGRRYMLMPIESSKNFKFEGDIRKFNGKTYVAKKGLGWAWTQETLDKKIQEGFILEETSTGKLTYRSYYTGTKRIDSIWMDLNQIGIIDNEYDTQKPESLLERIIQTSSNEGDTIADFYLGSGTTAVVSKKLNRNFIGCDINPKSIEITNKRLTKIQTLF